MADVKKEPDTGRSRTDLAHSVQQFFEQFGRALTAGDGTAIAGMWDTPAFVLADEGARTIASTDEIATFFDGVRAQYESRGIVDTRADLLWEEWLTERIVMVEVRWPYLDAAGHELGEELSTYTLRLDDSGALRVRIVVTHGVSQPH
ncbi:MAG TPA: hypothetical protein VM575_05910 [Nocardioides sp.]|nr:hypothetical protein [Nocardioides sp.]